MRGEDEYNASLFTSVRLENFVLSEHMLLQVLYSVTTTVFAALGVVQ